MDSGKTVHASDPSKDGGERQMVRGENGQLGEVSRSVLLHSAPEIFINPNSRVVT